MAIVRYMGGKELTFEELMAKESEDRGGGR